MYEAPFDGSWWVRPGEFLAGCYPLMFNGRLDRIRGLAEYEVEVVINLMEFNETSTSGVPCKPYANLLAQHLDAHLRAQRTSGSLFYHQLPIVDVSVPTRGEMIYILDTLENALAKGKVYLHCRGGHGRTATVVGCWLRRHGSGPEEALGYIRAMREGAGITSLAPQTESQRAFVKKWTEGKK